MTHEAIDISHHADLVRVLEEISKSGSSLVLRRDNKDVAIVTPLSDGKKRRSKSIRTKADFDAFVAAGGSWKDEDTDTLIEHIYAGRRSSRPPVEL